MQGLNLHIYPSPFRFETRILKETKSIVELKLAGKIIIASGWEPGLAKQETLDGRREVHRFKLITGGLPSNALFSLLKYIELIFRIVVRYSSMRVDVVNCHSLMVLPAGVLIKPFRKSVLIYDAHELETERLGLHGIAKRISKMLERALMPFVNEMIVVSDSIGRWYAKKYNLSKVHVIRNIPYEEDIQTFKSSILKDTFRIGPDELLFIYQGIIGRGRGIDIFLEVFSKLPVDKHMVFMGFGTEVDKIKEYAAKHPNIHFQPAVSPDQIKTYTSGADVGLHMAENVCLSYYYSLPNKFFEYIHCELPVIVSDFPDMSYIVNKYDCGWAIPVSADELYKKIMSLTIEEVQAKKANVRTCRLDYSWQNEEKKLAEIFKKDTAC